MSAAVWLEVTAGQGPAECARAVVRTVEEIVREAQAAGVACVTADLVPGPEPGTAQSALVALSGEGAGALAGSWRGSVQWIARSPFRPAHKRKNWFVGVEVLEPPAATRFDPADLRWETMRATGPGGQHVNRTESAVRVTHGPTGLQVMAREERSQLRNRALALARLRARLADLEAGREDALRQERWRSHHALERGNPVRIFRPEGAF